MRNNYNYSLYQVLLGYINKKGKKTKAVNILDSAFEQIFKRTKMLPSLALKIITSKLGSLVDVKIIKIRKNTHVVPFAVKMSRAEYLLAKKIIDSVDEDDSNRSFSEKLGDELLNIIQDKPCKSITRHKQMLKQAVTNRANSHFRW